MPFWLVECIFTQQDSFDDFLVGLTIERRVAAEQDVKNDTTAPQVALLIVALLEDLRCDVVRRPILLDHLLTGSVGSGSAEVDNGNACLIPGPIQEKVLRLQVPVHNIAAVAVVNCR